MAVSVLTAIMLALPESALALPSEVPDKTPMVDGRVRAIEQVGTNIWVGGRFTKVKERDGTVLDNVTNLAVFDSQTEQYKPLAPNLGGTGAEVWDMMVYGGTGPHADDVLIAGKFVDPDDPTNTKHKNLVLVDGDTGDVLRWYNSPSLKSVLAAPNLTAPGGDGRVYGGGVSLSAFDFDTGQKLWTKAKTTVDPTIRTHDSSPAYRDLELDADGQTIWAACVCDKVGTNPAKALVKLNIEGIHDASWVTEAGKAAFGQSVVDHDGKLYLAAGGSDFLAEYDKTAKGARGWVRDTSGSAQAVEVYGRAAGGRRALLRGRGSGRRPLRGGAPRGPRPERQSYARPLWRVQDETGHSRLLLPGRPRPVGPGLLGQLQPGVGAARRRDPGCTPAESSRRSAGSHRTRTRGSRRRRKHGAP